MEEHFKSYLYNVREKVLAIMQVSSSINSFFAVIMLVYRYGFQPDIEATQQIVRIWDIIFLIFVLSYFTRFIFSFQRTEYIKKTYFEFSMMLFLVIHGVINFITGVQLIHVLVAYLGFSNPNLTYEHLLSVYLIILVGLEVTKLSTQISSLDLKPATTFIMSFVLLILIGTGALMLPAMTSDKGSMNFLDALFTSVSASCVTGLAVEDTYAFFTMKGHLVLLLLIQLGGIGIVSFATFFASFLSKGVGLKHQSIIQDFLSSESLFSAKGLLRRIIFITLLIEFIGCFVIFFSWGEEMRKFSLEHQIFYSVFHSISAFCNAGFSLFPGGLSQVSDSTDFGELLHPNVSTMYSLHFVIGIIIILGGIGFNTIEDLFSPAKIRDRIRNPWKKWSVGTRIAVYGTLFLIALGTIGFMILEYNKLANMNIVQAFITSFFQSVTTRTAGFNTMDFADLNISTIVLCFFLMFIGTAPGSTGGGLKITTFVLIAMSSIANIKGQEKVILWKRTVANSLLRKAFAIFMFAISYNCIAIFFLSITESATIANDPQVTIVHVAFEQVSAFATVGVSMGFTGKLTVLGKCIIILSMFLGRVGTLTLALALSKSVKTNSYKYPDAHIMVG